MATIRKRRRSRKDVWLVDYLDAAGVRHRLTAKSREQAEDLLASKIIESREPVIDDASGSTTVSEYAKRWFAAIAHDLKPRTLVSYRQLFSLHIESSLGSTRLRDLQRGQVKFLLNQKRAAGLSKNTVRLIRACLSSMLAEAVDDSMLKANPAALASRRRAGKRTDSITPNERQKAIRPLSEEQIEALLNEARADREYYPLLLTLARTGVRPGEAMALQWDDLDFSNREILIERALSAGQIGTTKTGGVRRVDMSQTLAETLSQLFIEREKETLRRKWAEIPPWVFINRQGKPLDDSRLRKRFARILRRADLSGHRVYDLRHTFATLLLAKGTPITYVAAQLGHAKPTTTLQWYAHWLPRADDKGFVDSLDSPALPRKTGTDGDGSDPMPLASTPRHQFGTDPKFDQLPRLQVPDFIGGPLETRTPDPLIKSQLLYQLS